MGTGHEAEHRKREIGSGERRRTGKGTRKRNQEHEVEPDDETKRRRERKRCRRRCHRRHRDYRHCGNAIMIVMYIIVVTITDISLIIAIVVIIVVGAVVVAVVVVFSVVVVVIIIITNIISFRPLVQTKSVMCTFAPMLFSYASRTVRKPYRTWFFIKLHWACDFYAVSLMVAVRIAVISP